MISQTAEYALRAIILLAGNDPEPCTAQQIAAETKVPSGYLSKIMQSLARAGVVTSKRGLHGGFALARPPEDLSIHDVITAVDPIHRYESCPLNLPWHCRKMCKLHTMLDRMIGEFIETAQATHIADLLPAADPASLTEAQAKRIRSRLSKR